MTKSLNTRAINKFSDEKNIRNQRLILGDCLSKLEKLEANSVDVVVTSPPYNIGLAYNTYRDTKSENDYEQWVYEVAIQIKRVLKDNGSFFLNVGSTNKNPWTSMVLAQKLKSIYSLQNNIVWVKSISINDETYGHFKPINSRRFLNNNYENIFHFTKSNDVQLDRLAVGVPYKYKSNIKRFSQVGDLRCAGNVWFIPYKTTQSRTDKFNHPGTYPVELAVRCINLHGAKGATVLDPFLGSGTTLVAAAQIGCKGIGIDIDSEYLNIAFERIKNGEK